MTVAHTVHFHTLCKVDHRSDQGALFTKKSWTRVSVEGNVCNSVGRKKA